MTFYLVRHEDGRVLPQPEAPEPPAKVLKEIEAATRLLARNQISDLGFSRRDGAFYARDEAANGN